MSRFVPLSSQKIIEHAQNNGWVLKTSKGDIMDSNPFFPSEGIDRFDYLSSHKYPENFDLLSKSHFYVLLRSEHQDQTPIWFYDLNRSLIPHIELNALFFQNELVNSGRDMEKFKVFFCLIYDYFMSTNKSKSLIEPYIRNRDSYLDTKASFVGIEAFKKIGTDFPKRNLGSILGSIENY